MKNTYYYFIFSSIIALMCIGILLNNSSSNNSELFQHDSKPKERLDWMKKRLISPQTGEIPQNIRTKELNFSKSLPKDNMVIRGESNLKWKSIGPFNIGGRTRAFGIDINDNDNLVAGGVTGGMWRSTNGGKSWKFTNGSDAVRSVTCITQDPRPGKSHIWYYGSGEADGSAGRSTSSIYAGDGISKSIDSGKTWVNLPQTNSGTPTSIENWDIIWNIRVDPANTTEDVVYAAIRRAIMKSSDGGQTWKTVLDGTGSFSSQYTNIEITSKGVLYATFDGDNSKRGIWRSIDGENWNRISPSGWPSRANRTIMAVNPQNENVVYFLAESENKGQFAYPNDPDSERHVLWKYEYKSGDGSGTGGKWKDLSSNIPNDDNSATAFESQGSYCMTIAIRPQDSNLVIIGGTNLYRSKFGFKTTTHTSLIGGYKTNPTNYFDYRYNNHHPDQHLLIFNPSNTNELFCSNDGGIYKTKSITASNVTWEELNNGFVNSQFYTVAVDHETVGSNVVIGGLQDNSSQWTDSDDFEKKWTTPSLGDGSYCAIEDGGDVYYFSSQRGVIYKMSLDDEGNRKQYARIDPSAANDGNYLFINPFILDRTDNNVMFVAENKDLWRNDNVGGISMNGSLWPMSSGWTRISDVVPSRITAFESSTKPENILYIGTSSSSIYKLEKSTSTFNTATDITSNIGDNSSNGSYVSDIAVNPEDANEIIVVYSNYDAYSAYHTTDQGATWNEIAGNLEEPLQNGLPSNLIGIGDGPSVRCAAIIPTEKGTAYFLGTSVGLFGTHNLEGLDTKWVQQGTDVIGSAIVDMIDFRQKDGFIAIATHGNGVFTTYMDKAWDITSINNYKDENVDFSVFPNPAEIRTTLSFYSNDNLNTHYSIFDISGKNILQQSIFINSGVNNISIDLSNLNSGNYILQLKTSDRIISKKLIIR